MFGRATIRLGIGPHSSILCKLICREKVTKLNTRKPHRKMPINSANLVRILYECITKRGQSRSLRSQIYSPAPISVKFGVQRAGILTLGYQFSMSRILCIKGMFHWAENRDWKLIGLFISRGHVLRDWQWCKITDDDDEYMNAAAAHAAFVMAVSASRILVITWHKYSFTRHINIHKLHPLPEKKLAWALPILCWNRLHRNSRVR